MLFKSGDAANAFVDNTATAGFESKIVSHFVSK